MTPTDDTPDDEAQSRVPIADVLTSMTIHPLGPGENPLEAFVLIKLLDAEGRPSWSFRTTNPLNRYELLGALIVQVDLLKRELVDRWIDDEENDEE